MSKRRTLLAFGLSGAVAEAESLFFEFQDLES